MLPFSLPLALHESGQFSEKGTALFYHCSHSTSVLTHVHLPALRMNILAPSVTASSATLNSKQSNTPSKTKHQISLTRNMLTENTNIVLQESTQRGLQMVEAITIRRATYSFNSKLSFVRLDA